MAKPRMYGPFETATGKTYFDVWPDPKDSGGALLMRPKTELPCGKVKIGEETKAGSRKVVRAAIGQFARRHGISWTP